MARLTEYNFDLCIEICDQIAEGKNIIEVLDSNEEYPSWSTFRRWKRDNDELQTLYVNSIQDKSEYLLFEMSQIEKELRDKKIDPSTANVLIQTLKWKASKFYPKMFGDKIQQDIEVKGQIDTVRIFELPDNGRGDS